MAVKAQSVPLKIMDFSLEPLINAGGSPDATKLIVSFKINKCDSAFKAHIYCGTQKDLADVKSVESVFVQENGKCFTLFNGIKTEIQGYKAIVEIPCSQQEYDAVKDIALFIEKITGQNTSRLYTKK